MQGMPRDFRVELLRRSLKVSGNVEQSYGQRRLDHKNLYITREGNYRLDAHVSINS